MSLRVLVDVNLSPEWIAELNRHGYSAVHWSSIGDSRATDATIMAWARANGHVVFTHDLDFGAILALTHAEGPSVLQVRGQDILPDDISSLVIAALRQHEATLAAGAIVALDKRKSRVRVCRFDCARPRVDGRSRLDRRTSGLCADVGGGSRRC